MAIATAANQTHSALRAAAPPAVEVRLSIWPCNAPVATAVQRSSTFTIWLFYHAAAPHKGAATALALYLPFPAAMLLVEGYRIIYI